MERNLTPLKDEVEALGLSSTKSTSKCGACREEFEQPLLAMVFSDALVEEYYACPKCLSKVTSLDRKKQFEVCEAEGEKLVEPVKATDEAAEALDGPLVCAHELGYLKRRAKNTPIPEECLTCVKIIECMY